MHAMALKSKKSQKTKSICLEHIVTIVEAGGAMTSRSVVT